MPPPRRGSRPRTAWLRARSGRESALVRARPHYRSESQVKRATPKATGVIPPSGLSEVNFVALNINIAMSGGDVDPSPNC